MGRVPTEIRKDVIYRQYEAGDNPAIRELNIATMEAAGAYIPGYYSDLNDIEGIYMRDAGEFMVCNPCEQPELRIAMGGFKNITFDIAELKRLRVHPAYQGRGIGRTLLEKLERIAVIRGFGVMQLDTRSVQVASQKLYESAGYWEVRREVEEPFGEVIAYEKLLF